MFPSAAPFAVTDHPQLGEPLLTVSGDVRHPIAFLTDRVTQLEAQLQWHTARLVAIELRLQTPWYRRVWALLKDVAARWRRF